MLGTPTRGGRSAGALPSRGEVASNVVVPRPSKPAMVATAFPAATEAALEILRAGGNAIDAAAAAAWALAVCEPSGSGLGGQATLLLHRPGEGCTVLDGHSHGPAAITRRSMSRAEQRRGWKACTIPSMPATIGSAVERFGRLSLAETLGPAIRLAHDGVVVTKLMRRHIQWCRAALSASPGAAGTFLPDGKVPSRGSRLVQPVLARTLRRLAEHGVSDLYRGEMAVELAEEMSERGGLITRADLAACVFPIERSPLSIRYRGHEVVSVPPPGGGAQLLLGLKVAESLDLASLVGDEVAWYEALAVLIESIFRERARWPIDPERLSPSFLSWMLSDDRAAEIAREIRSGTSRPGPRPAEGPGDTTHLCVADPDGMVVSLTQSVQSLYGAKVASERLGFIYNNYLCTCPRYRHPSRLGPNAMPQSNAAPAFVFSGAKGAPHTPMLALGAAGSRRITSSLLQVILQVIDRGQSIDAALDAPRIHTMLTGRPMLERRIATEPLLTRLAARYRPAQIKAAHSYSMGAVQAIQRSADGNWIGAADTRREGSADGC